jgi:TorA maturation chaperone TorD
LVETWIISVKFPDDIGPALAKEHEGRRKTSMTSTGTATPLMARDELASTAAAEASQYDQLRAGAYSLLAQLLRQPPSAELLARLAEHHVPERKDENEFAVSLRLLGLAAAGTTPAQAAEEFQNLFIGLGRGELVPYGSWYQTGFLMEQPLGVLRDDLARLGFTRQENVHEPEDHVAALCEVLAMGIEDGLCSQQQEAFFRAHLAPWGARFWRDLQDARSACFYCAVGRFGAAFNDLETQLFELKL